MHYNAHFNMITEVIAKQYEVVRDVASRNNICEKTLTRLCNEFLSAGRLRIDPPGDFNLDSASCSGTTVTVDGNIAATQSGEVVVGIHAVLVPTGQSASMPSGDPEFEDFPFDIEADPGFDGDVLAWGVFDTTTRSSLGAERVSLSSSCDD